jgi:polyketide biosynthesis enoyl-CoA hydratase PksI
MADAVRLSCPGDGIALVAMEEREGRNTFTEKLIVGLADVFGTIAADPAARVVVLHGYDSIFSAGGTREELLNIADRKQKFDEAGFYRMLLDLPLPVIAAMQGHALGGGLVFGLYADLVVLAEESLYATNFLKYGFTPGMGATAIVPERFGALLGGEMLYTAAGFHGGALRQRGVGCPVLPRAQVIDHAIKLARDLADKPGIALRELKAALTAPLRAALPAAVERETRMHEITFAQSDIRDRIRSRYGR